jgi:two-component system, NarL family, invasion response regulator UvrY
MKILLVDDHAVVRKGLKQILADELSRPVFGEAADAEETLAKVKKENWDILILDINLPGKSGLDILSNLKKLRPALPILYLSVNAEDQYAVRVLRSGAAGYLAKESAPEELVTAVKKVLAGGKYLSPLVAEKIATGLVPETEKQPHESLSDREFQVLRLVGAGKTLTEIARLLSLSLPTVSTYRLRILEKMKMENNAELMRYAIERQLV